jgi:hypothetical protein
VDNFLFVNKDAGFDQLVKVVPGLENRESLSAPDQVAEGVVLADVQQNVHVFLVFEVPLELDRVTAVVADGTQRLVDLDLRLQLHSSFRSLQISLGDHFARVNPFGVIFALHFVALGEPSLHRSIRNEKWYVTYLSEESSFDVVDLASIEVSEFFDDDLQIRFS